MGRRISERFAGRYFHFGPKFPANPTINHSFLGRIKIRFHWQLAEAADDRDSCWVRVLNRQAGPAMGWQWLPRIGQEVLEQTGAQIPMAQFGQRYITYAGGKVHDVAEAIKYLKANVIGFFVEMPLTWGDGVVVDGDPSGHGSVDIAQGDTTSSGAGRSA